MKNGCKVAERTETSKNPNSKFSTNSACRLKVFFRPRTHGCSCPALQVPSACSFASIRFVCLFVCSFDFVSRRFASLRFVLFCFASFLSSQLSVSFRFVPFVSLHFASWFFNRFAKLKFEVAKRSETRKWSCETKRNENLICKAKRSENPICETKRNENPDLRNENTICETKRNENLICETKRGED